MNTLEKPDFIIYVKTDPKKCLKRVKQRNRDEEKYITLKYLMDLHTEHEDYIARIKRDPDFEDIEIITINGDLNVRNMEEEYERAFNRLLCKKMK